MNNNPLNIDQILKILPHRYPFLLIDKVISIKFDNSIEAQKILLLMSHILLGIF